MAHPSALKGEDNAGRLTAQLPISLQRRNLLLKLDRNDGSIMHAEVKIGNNRIMIGEPTEQIGAMPVSLYVYVTDCDKTYQAAIQAGAMSIMDVRVISTSAVRCVGNTLLLHGQVFSPPFKITAIGEPTAMHQALESAEGVQQFRAAVADFGLGYQETVERNVTVRAYDGSSDLRSARVAE